MTDVDIVNRSLRLLGVATMATAMTDTSPAAVVSAITAYPLCRDEVLRLLPWPSVTRRDEMRNWNDQATPWENEHVYYPGDRCTNGGDTYECTVAGISAAAGGPAGTGSGIVDGTVTWAYKEASAATNNWCWITLTDYVLDELVSWDVGRVYACITAGTSGAAGPTGTDADITDGTVHWRYYGEPGRNLTVYNYTYMLPSNCLRALKVPKQYATKESQQGEQFLIENRWLYTDELTAILRYIVKELAPNNWDDLLQWCITYKIAAEIAFQVTGKQAMTDKMFERFAGTYQTARHAAMSEGAEAPPEPVLWTD